MELIVTRLVALLAVASIVAILARRLHLPYTVGLVLTGVSLPVMGITGGITLTHDLIFIVILPPLMFEAALALGISWPDIRRDAVPILVLATIGVLMSAAIVAVGMIEILEWPVTAAVIFGTLIAATDPVAVIAMFKDNGVEGRVRLLVESESLLNDGVAAVLFGLVLVWADGGVISTGAAIEDLAATVGGGILIGGVVAACVLALAGRTADHLIETVLSAVAAYGSFLAAEHFHVSGILATVSAGLVLGRPALLGPLGAKLFGSSVFSQRGHTFLDAFWEFSAFLANSLIFLLIGLATANMPFRGPAMTAVSISALLVLLARGVSVYGLCLPFVGSRWHVSSADQHVLWWGGLRGALALALALSLPESLAYRDEITITTFGVVALSVIVQGLTMPSLLKVLGMLPTKHRA